MKEKRKERRLSRDSLDYRKLSKICLETEEKIMTFTRVI